MYLFSQLSCKANKKMVLLICSILWEEITIGKEKYTNNCANLYMHNFNSGIYNLEEYNKKRRRK